MCGMGDLTERELEVLALVAEAASNSTIGDQLFLSDRTVESHLRAVYAKLGLPASLEGGRRVRAALIYLEETGTRLVPLAA